MFRWNGERAKELREAAGLAQAKAADAAGVNQTTILRIERGEFPPRADILFRLADAYGVSCEQFRKKPGSPIKQSDEEDWSDEE